MENVASGVLIARRAQRLPVYAPPSSRLAALPWERAYLTQGPGGLPTKGLFEQSLSNCHVRVSGVVYNQEIFGLFNTPINGG